MHKGVAYALLSAVLFGASTPFAKTLLGQVPPVMLAGLLYAGSGVGLLTWFFLRSLFARGGRDSPARLTGADLPWLGGAILAGGIAGPLLLLAGLALMPASAASLLLNMEGVLTAMLAWFVFKENVDRRIFAGMLLIVLAGALLSWQPPAAPGAPSWGPLAVVGACLCWAIDNNLTRKVSASDALQIAGVKGLVAGTVNLAIALALGVPPPGAGTIAVAALVGLCGYGLSLVLFVLALRHLGTARTGAYFSVAPFAGAAIALLLPGPAPGALFWGAAALMAAGIWLHLTEVHGHAHAHEPMAHAHWHSHDAHHRHAHDFPCDEGAAHSHPHRHEPLTHTHPHCPDIHHRHDHS